MDWLTPQSVWLRAKPGIDPCIEARVIHNLSYPQGGSTNDRSKAEDIPQLSYEFFDAIARRILELRQEYPGVVIRLMKGDVKSAFQNVPLYEQTSQLFAGSIPEHGVVSVTIRLDGIASVLWRIW